MTSSEPDSQFEALLDYVKRTRGFDFTGYKRSSLMRRVAKRLQEVRLERYNDYIDYLEVHPDEFVHLFNTLLINVTSFFRDSAAWDCLINELLPLMVARKDSGDMIRIWSAGCATGEEPYSLAIAIAETIGVEQFAQRVKIYATDIDEEALSYARQATYQDREVSGLTPEVLERYFEQTDSRYTFRKDLRRSVIFGRHDLIQDAPISRIDLLVCRNTLMYFNAETQARTLARFHFALQENGLLFLGKAEMLLTHTSTFTPVVLKYRIFSKVPKVNLRDRLLIMTQMGNDEGANDLASHIRLREVAFDSSPIAQIAVDTNGILTLINAQARELFGLSTRDVGRPLQDLEISYRPVELRSCIERTYLERRPLTIRNVGWQRAQADSIFLDVQVAPMIDALNSTLLGVSITFTDVTQYKSLQEELEHANHELEMAYEELQSTNEELETTNEELQSANEELETTNEELQSTNEELETMNEELHSTNEELQTVNSELQCRSEELNQSNAFLELILTSLKGGVVVIDRELQVQVWNYRAEDLWGVRSSEALNQNFFSLEIGLPTEQLQPPIRQCLSDQLARSVNITLPAVNRRGKTIRCHVTCTPLRNLESGTQGVILIMEEVIEE